MAVTDEAIEKIKAMILSGELPAGSKPFVDDGNSFFGLGPIPAVTHGPRAGGQHTVNEWVEIDDLVRIAALYALTAVAYCSESLSGVQNTGCSRLLESEGV